MTGVLEFLETNTLVMWIEGSPSVFAYPTILALHTVGMAFLVGTGAALSLRALGVAPNLPLRPLDGLFPVAWVGCWLATLSGALLLAGKATRFLTMPTFYIKLAAIVLALLSMRLLRSTVYRGAPASESDPVPRFGKIQAGATLTFWAVAVVAGRATAYWGPTGWKTAGAFLVLALFLAIVGRSALRLWNRPKRFSDARPVRQSAR